MKKSEYRKMRMEDWSRCEAFQAMGLQNAAVLVDRDVAAVEALPGWKWDLEEPGLPGRVNLGMFGRSVHDFTGATLFNLVPTQEPLPRIDLLAAMVKLWNAWGTEGELRERLEGVIGKPAPSCDGEATLVLYSTLRALLAKPWEEKRKPVPECGRCSKALDAFEVKTGLGLCLNCGGR